MKSKVAVLSCDDYTEEKVYEKIRAGFELLGGAASFFKSDEKILLKPNLVRGAAVERAVFTHPAVMTAVSRVLYEAGSRNISVGDSCGFGQAEKIMQESGMLDGMKRYGVKTADFSAEEHVQFEAGGRKHEFILSKPVCDADALISVSKMKTHALEHITGAVKNQYGCICGLHKAQGHTKYPTADSFARMLIRLNQCVKPRLYIMDGITAMEGNGPTSGDPVHMGLILMSTDPVAMDSIFARLVYLNPEYVPTNVHGENLGLGSWQEENIEIVTEEGVISMEELVKTHGNPNFNVERKRSKGRGILGNIGFLRVFQKKPYIESDKCKKCGICVESCPVEGKAVRFANGRKEVPVYDYKKCIRCFCCQEMCPHKAIRVR